MRRPPSPKAEKLLKTINQHLKDNKADQSVLTQLKRDATQLLKHDVIGGYVVLGALASLSADIANIHVSYQNALALEPHDPEIISNYATSLHNTGFFWEAADLAFKAYLFAPDNLQWLARLIEHNIYAGRLHRAKKLLNSRVYKLAPYYTYHRVEFVSQLVHFMDEHAITDQDLENLVKTVISVLHKHQFYDFNGENIEIYALEDEYAKWYHYGVKLHHFSIDEVVHLCFELAETLVTADISVNNTSDFFIPSFHLAETF